MDKQIEEGQEWQHKSSGRLYVILAAAAQFDELEAQTYVVMVAADGNGEWANRVWIRSKEQFLQKFERVV